MARKNVLTTEEAFLMLEQGYILENEHGFKVWLYKGKQFITNKRRLYKRKNFDYAFDYPTWRVVGRNCLLFRLKELYYRAKRRVGLNV
jgi:hypothetical protein